MRGISRRLSYANVMSTIAVFAALGTGGAYAAGSIRGSDIIDNEVSSADVRDDNLGFGGLAAQDLGPGSVRSSEVQDESLTNADIKNFSLGNGDFLTGSVDGRVVTEDSLTGADIASDSLTGTDINESTLNLPPSTTATFAFGTPDTHVRDTFVKVASKSLPAGSYAVVATAQIGSGIGSPQDEYNVSCELRNGTNAIGGTTDRRTKPAHRFTISSLSLNGGAQVPAGGGEVSLWCRHGDGLGTLDSAQMMILRIAGFN